MNLFGYVTWQAVFSLVVFLVGTYCFFTAVLFITQSRLIYFPTRQITATPEEIGLEFKAVSFFAEDGVRLSGWFVPARPSMGVVLFCHGNAGNISGRLGSIEIFHRLGLSTFIFDYRGYGSSAGTPSEKGTYRDAEAAWRYLVDEARLADRSEIIVFGRSLGGAVAAWLAKEERPRALIIESTFTSVPDIAAALYPFLPARLLCRYDYDALAAVRAVRCPVLVVHSRDDDIVPFEHGRRLFDAANHPKSFLEISGDHNTGFLASGRMYIDGLMAFLEGLAHSPHEKGLQEGGRGTQDDGGGQSREATRHLLSETGGGGWG